jgi:hypothetical protein
MSPATMSRHATTEKMRMNRDSTSKNEPANMGRS